MSCDHDGRPVNYDVFMDRTQAACNPQYAHDISDETSAECFIQMEHSYSRDHRPSDKTMATQTILVHKPPPCPSCHNSTDESEIVDMDEDSQPVPDACDAASREAMDVIGNIAAKVKNRNLEEDDWEELIDKTGWTVYQHTIFGKVAEVLSLDRLARLTYANHPKEPIMRKTSIAKAVQRLRKAFAVVHWDLKLTQWLHGLLIDHLPVSYVTAYMDILQALRAKVPSLVDKMVQGRSNELLEALIKPPWEPTLEAKDRKISPEPVFVIMPSGLPSKDAKHTEQTTRWGKLFATLSSHVRTIEIPTNFAEESRLDLPNYLERQITYCRTRLMDVRREYPQKAVILVGFNSGAALAIQLASMEQNINSIICMGFSTNTLRGNRGTLDDRLVDLSVPVLFVIGQNAARTSPEQIESLREQMIAPTALVVVGSADDCLHVPSGKRRLENVTQAMVNSMIMDEVVGFATSCVNNPPSPVKKRPVVPPATVAPTTIVILDSPDKNKYLSAQLTTAGLARKPRSPIKAGRIQKKKINVGVATTMSPPKKEYAEKLSLTTPGNTTSYEIVTGKIGQDSSMRQVVDKGFIQIASENMGSKWQVATNGRPSGPGQVVSMIQKQKISLGNQFTPMRTNSEHLLLGKPGTGRVISRGGLLTHRRIVKPAAVQPQQSAIETIELDSEEEIIMAEETIVDGQVVDETIELEVAPEEIPVVFQESPEAANTASGNVVVGGQTIIPRPNKFIYYKPQQVVTKTPQTQYVVLSSLDDKPNTVSIPGNSTAVSSKPLIISVESVEKGGPNTVYHVVDDPVKEE